MNSRDFIRQTPSFYAAENRYHSIWRSIHADPPLLVGVILLCAFGLFVLYSASGGELAVVRRQALIMLAGILVMFIVSQFNPHVIRRWPPTIYAGGLALLFLVLFIGKRYYQ